LAGKISIRDNAGADQTRTVWRRAFDFFVFSSLYIALCAMLMVYQTYHLFHLKNEMNDMLLFVFFSTICSYNFHWYLTPAAATEMIRVDWTQHHKKLHLFLYVVGLVGAGWLALRLISHWFWLSGAVILTFLYSAPKIPYKPFTSLRQVAVGKTIFLSFVWMYVTSFLPLIFAEQAFNIYYLLFCISRFFLIYSICIIFDYRDRENDRKDGIRSMITMLDERGINILFYFSLLIFAITTLALIYFPFAPEVVFLLLSPGIIVLALYKKAKTNFSDYLYYFVLDGLMMFSALFTSFLSI
jgi:4-hydroxybenzoate polyprenyltransferase